MRTYKLDLKQDDLWYLKSLCKDELKKLESRTDLTKQERVKALDYLEGLKSRLKEKEL